MITEVSALLDRKTRYFVLFGPDRARVVSALAEAGVDLHEISLALNCSVPMVHRFLRPTPLFWANELVELRKRDDLRDVPRNLRGLVHYRPSRTEKGKIREREQLAVHLAREICLVASSVPIDKSGKAESG